MKPSCSSLVIDLSPHSIAVGIISLSKEKNALPVLEYVFRAYTSYEHRPESTTIYQKLRELLSNILKGELGAHLGKVDSVYVVHSLAWSLSLNRRLVIDSPKEIVVTEEALGALARSKEASPVNMKSMKLISRTIREVRLNGYEVKNPWGKKTTSLSADASETYVDSTIVSLVEKMLREYLHAKPVHLTEADVAKKFFLYTNPSIADAMLFHIGGETTEINFLQNKMLFRSVSLPYGVNTLCRDFATTMKSNHSVGYAHINAHLSGDRLFTKKEKECYTKLMSAWQNNIKETVTKASPGILPDTLCALSLPHYHALAVEALTAYHPVFIENPEHTKLYRNSEGIATDPLITIALIAVLT